MQAPASNPPALIRVAPSALLRSVSSDANINVLSLASWVASRSFALQCVSLRLIFDLGSADSRVS